MAEAALRVTGPRRRGARTLACRVGTRAHPRSPREKRVEISLHGTHECVRYSPYRNRLCSRSRPIVVIGPCLAPRWPYRAALAAYCESIAESDVHRRPANRCGRYYRGIKCLRRSAYFPPESTEKCCPEYAPECADLELGIGQAQSITVASLVVDLQCVRESSCPARRPGRRGDRRTARRRPGSCTPLARR